MSAPRAPDGPSQAAYPGGQPLETVGIEALRLSRQLVAALTSENQLVELPPVPADSAFRSRETLI